MKLPARDDVKKWLTKPGRGVEFGELWSIAGSFFYAWRAVDTFDGRPVAPLTSRVFLGTGDGLWYWVLIINGCLVTAALLLGLITGNTYRIRSYVSLASSCAWVLIALVALFANMPSSVAMGYVLTCVVSWCTAVLLSALADMPTTKPHLPFLPALRRKGV